MPRKSIEPITGDSHHPHAMILLYTGESRLQPGAPVFAALTTDSANRKTGAMDQVWILAADSHPVAAVKTGADAAVCGSCALRGSAATPRACYVNVAWAPAAVYRAFHRGQYEDRRDSELVFEGRTIRLGAYGDPAALPWWWWIARLRAAAGWTGYTHAWRTCAPVFRRFCMASVESPADLQAAQARGYRTFRVRDAAEPVLSGEVVCPASAEAGHRTTCAACRLCNGTPRTRRHPPASVTIQAHGAPRAFAQQRQGLLPW